MQRSCVRCNIVNQVDLPGSARSVLADGVVPLDPEPAVFAAMLEGWTRQQRVRFLKEETIARRVALVRRVHGFCDLYPWQWTVEEVEAFVASRRDGARPIAVSTARGYQVDLRLFLEFLTDARYGWQRTCLDRFGRAPEQLLHSGNVVVHASEFEGRPSRRPLTYDEIQRLFDTADGQAELIRARGRKGALAAQRNAALLKVIYAFGLRRREAWGLDLGDSRRNPKLPQFGSYGGVFVRWGKSSRGGQPKRRTVLLVPEMDWVVPVIEQWLTELRPRFSPGNHPALWITERRSRLALRKIDLVFQAARAEAGLDPELDLHCLRHSYITHLIEFDYPERFVQDQVGHAYASTTSIYTGVGDDYRNRLIARALRNQHSDLWEVRP